uniref:Uncharacterized protein n=1 Tax=Panagrolaimus davidi TaxID=227884 RepID=A0A914QJM0_9BILA
MIVILAMEKPKINWDRWGELCLTVSAFLDCLVLIAMASAQKLWIMYTGYIIFRVAYQAMITTAQLNIVCRIASNNLGFVFGINTFIALSLQTALTAIVVEKSALGLSIRKQFYVYSAYHAGIGFIFLLAIIGRFIRNRWQLRRRTTTIF